MNRFMVLLVGVAMVLVGAAAFANGAQEDGSGTAAEAVTPDRPLWYMNPNQKPGFASTESIVTDHIKEQFGFDVEIESYTETDFFTKLNVYVASGDYPDFWKTPNRDAVLNVMNWKNQGTIQPVTELVETYGENLPSKIYDSSFAAMTFDGELWAVPGGWNRESSSSSPNASGVVIRMDWLDKLGLDVPETLSELKNVVRAFVERDPDGDGKRDTVGLSMDNRLGSLDVITGAYGVTANAWMVQDGRVVRQDMTEAYVEAVGEARTWYEEGLIDPEFPALTHRNTEEKWINGNAGVSMWNPWAPHPRWRLMPVLKQNFPEADLDIIPAVVGPDGKGGYPQGSTLKGGTVVSAETPYAVQVVELLDWLLTDDNYYLYKLGVKGEHWQWGDDGKPEYLVDWLNDQNEKIKHGLGNPGSMIAVIDRTQWEPEISPFFDTINERIIENAFQGGVPAMADHPEIDVDFKETLVRVIIGDLPLLELEKAQQRWYQSGGNEITEQVNEWYAGQQ